MVASAVTRYLNQFHYLFKLLNSAFMLYVNIKFSLEHPQTHFKKQERRQLYSHVLQVILDIVLSFKNI